MNLVNILLTLTNFLWSRLLFLSLIALITSTFNTFWLLRLTSKKGSSALALVLLLIHSKITELALLVLGIQGPSALLIRKFQVYTFPMLLHACFCRRFFFNDLLFSERQILVMVNVNRKGKSIQRSLAYFLTYMVCGVITLCCFVLQTFWRIQLRTHLPE